ncbi:MAG: hypothetical protein VX606_10055, partial [Pseudomonadota bacterium]|nr:hypothetical protein [Pseudomonadota bacterium]
PITTTRAWVFIRHLFLFYFPVMPCNCGRMQSFAPKRYRRGDGDVEIIRTKRIGGKTPPTISRALNKAF